MNLKTMVNFVKGDVQNQNNSVEEEKVEVKQKQPVMPSEEKVAVQSLKDKLSMNQTDMKMEKSNNIYDSNVFTEQSNLVKISKPKSFESVEIIGEAIKDNKVIILDMNRLETTLATRILDFINGVCFAYNIAPVQVEAKIFMIDPNHKKKR